MDALSMYAVMVASACFDAFTWAPALLVVILTRDKSIVSTLFIAAVASLLITVALPLVTGATYPELYGPVSIAATVLWALFFVVVFSLVGLRSRTDRA